MKKILIILTSCTWRLEVTATQAKPAYAGLKPLIFRKSAQADLVCIAAISNRQGLVQDMIIDDVP